MILIPPRLHPGQLEVIRSPARWRIVVAGRRWGKTRLAVWEAVTTALRARHVWWVAPTYAMARAGWDTAVALSLQIPGAQLRLGTMEILYPGGGRLWVRSGDDPQRLRGFGLDLAVLDEAAYMAGAVWHEAIRPALADRQGRALLISTPRGQRGWFYELVRDAQPPDWAVFRAPTTSAPHIPPDEIEAMRRSLPAWVFAQEVLAEFVDPGSTLVRREWIAYAPPPPNVTTYMGVDLAISQREGADYTAIVVVARAQDGTLYVLDAVRGHYTFRQTLEAISRMATRYAPASVAVEAVQYQIAVVQELARTTALPVRPVRPRGSKVERAGILAVRYEQGVIRHAQRLPDLEEELTTFPNGPHDDLVDALVYAVMAAGGAGLSYLEQVRHAAR